MNFYEFNDFGYYALIGAKTEEEAIKYYEETVCDINEEQDGEPKEITREEAKGKLLNICKNEEEKAEASAEFDAYSQNTEPYLVLIDRSLL